MAAERRGAAPARFLLLCLALTAVLSSDGASQVDSFWTRCNPLPSGVPLHGAFFFDSARAWFVGSQGVVISTTDGGARWSERVLVPRTELQRIHFIDASRGVTIGGGNSGAIFSTSDGGTTWIDRYDVPTRDPLFDLSFRGDTGWAAGSSGILKSTDGGVTWGPSGSTIFWGTASVFFLSDSLGWAASSNGKIFESPNAGASWDQIADLGLEQLFRIRFATPLIGWTVGRRMYEPEATIFKTTDGGLTWTLQDTLAGRTFTDLYVEDTERAWAVGSGGSVHSTTDGGGTWFTELTNNADDYGQILFVGGKPWIIGGGTAHGTILTTGPPGFRWIEKNASVTQEALLSAAFEDDRTGWIGGANGTLLRTTDRGDHWGALPLFSVDILSMSAPAAGCLYAGGTSGKFLRTTDAGKSWSVRQIPQLYAVSNLQFVDSANGWALDDYSPLTRTTDGGLTWEPLPVSGTRFFFADASHGWLALPLVTTAASDEWTFLYRTTDGGSTWSDSLLAVGIADFSFADESVGWLLTSDAKMYRTQDGGATWEQRFTFGEQVRRIAFTTPTDGWALGLDAVYATTDGGASFTVSRHLDDRSAQALYFSSRSLGFTLGDGGSILRYDNPASAVGPLGGAAPPAIPATMLLGQNYPNPFNPTTRIRFTLPRAGMTTLRVYDLLGRVAAILIDREMPPGTQEVIFDAEGLAGGVYVYRLESEGIFETRKLVLVK